MSVRLVSGSVVVLAAALVLSCGGGSVAPVADSGPQACTDDNQCPTGYSCSGGWCVLVGNPDAGVDQAPPPKMMVSPTMLDFGSPYIGGEYAKTFTIANVGVADLTVSSLNLIEDRTTGAFTVTASPVPFKIPGGEEVTVTVTLRPNDENLPTGSIKIHSDDPDSATADATVDLVSRVKGAGLLGTCVINTSPPPDCAVTNDGNPVIAYGTVDYGTSAERVVRLTNVGDGNLPVEITGLSLTDTTHFALSLFAWVEDPANPGVMIEQPVTQLPFYLSIGDSAVTPPLPATELRVHVKFTAVGIDGTLPVESLVVTYNLTGSPTSIPITGQINGCMPTATDAGVPDGPADPQIDPNNCGTCGHVCTVDHGTPKCEGGVCKVASCETNWDDCDTLYSTGCEADLRISKENCSACGTPCVNAHGTTSCVSAACSPVCDPSYFGDCDGNANNGCETDLRTGLFDPATSSFRYCGNCQTTCSNPHGSTTCALGVCAPTCAFGFKDCDGVVTNGCETNIRTDVNNCGECANECVNPSGTVGCSAGVCVPGCASGTGDCDGNTANGCETDILSSNTHCGGCNSPCVAQNGGNQCTSGACVPACTSGFGDCDNNPANGCETNNNTNSTHCGACNHACTNAQGSGSTCATGACTAPVCIGGWGNCDGDNWNGCEQQLNTDLHCGTCNNRCQAVNGSNVCGGTVCTPTCNPGFGDCDGNPSNGCESDLSTVTLCGACTQDSQCAGLGAWFCNGTQCEKKRPPGTGCGVAKECVSNYCVDGRCCVDACTTTCKSCANASGTCTTNIPRYSEDPNGSPTCGGVYSCDGAGNCKKDNGQSCVNASECASGFCVDGTCCEDGCTIQCKSCANANGTCTTNVARFGEDTNSSPTCSGTNSCDGAGNCRKDSGQTCTAGTDCASGFCVDGYCCGAASCPACQSCGIAGSQGTCTNIAQGQTDTNPAGTCIAPNACDGAGNCRKNNGQTCTASTDCVYGNCIDGYCCDTGCSAACKACNVAGSLGTCTNIPSGQTDTNPAGICIAPNACDGAGNCKKQVGQSCSGASECVNGYCVDGYCCGTASCTTCQSCGLAGTLGTCTNIPSGQPDTNPAGTCVSPRACDGNGNCEKVNGQTCTSGTECVSGNCVDGYCCGSASCGTCQSCGLAGSLGTCTNIAQGQTDTNPAGTCIAPNACDGAGHCRKANGQTCANGTECASGKCVDGYCCNSDCTATCQACNVAGSQGTCSNIPAGTQDTYPANTCVSPNACDGNGTCKRTVGQPCAVGGDCLSNYCVDGVCCSASACSTCQSCGLTGSLGTCTNIPYGTTDTNPASTCVAPRACDGSGNCEKVNGTACGAGSECLTGYCVDGVCCASSVCASCQSCALATSLGSCANIPYGTTDTNPANTCVAPRACDGNGNCEKVNGTACGAGSECLTGYCVDGVCCGTSSCPTCQSCGLATSLGTCANIPYGTTDTNPANACVAPYACDGTGNCEKVTGSGCSVGSDCLTGYCVDGYCCSASACGVCQSCGLSGTQGTCTNIVSGQPDNNPTGTCAAPTYACNGAGQCKKATGQSCAVNGDCVTNTCCSLVCVDPLTNPSHCGGCGQACTNAHGSGSTCVAGACTAPSCDGGWYNEDSNNWNGCECWSDSISSACGTAFPIGSVALDGTWSNTYSLVPRDPGDSDWFVVSFGNSECAFSPQITVTPLDGDAIRLHVYTDCSSTAMNCKATQGGDSAKAGLIQWGMEYPAMCGDMQAIDPTPATVGQFIQGTPPGGIPNPTTFYIEVYLASSSTSCKRYTLTVSN
jgi:hypothetical protein